MSIVPEAFKRTMPVIIRKKKRKKKKEDKTSKLRRLKRSY